MEAGTTPPPPLSEDERRAALARLDEVRRLKTLTYMGAPGLKKLREIFQTAENNLKRRLALDDRLQQDKGRTTA